MNGKDFTKWPSSRKDTVGGTGWEKHGNVIWCYSKSIWYLCSVGPVKSESCIKVMDEWTPNIWSRRRLARNSFALSYYLKTDSCATYWVKKYHTRKNNNTFTWIIKAVKVLFIVSYFTKVNTLNLNLKCCKKKKNDPTETLHVGNHPHNDWSGNTQA